MTKLFWKLVELHFAKQESEMARQVRPLPADDIAAKGKLLRYGWHETVQSTGRLSCECFGFGYRTYLHLQRPSGRELRVHVQTRLPLIGTLYPLNSLRRPIFGTGWLARRRFNKAAELA